MLADAVVGDVESAERQHGDVQRSANQIEQLVTGNDGLVGRATVDLGDAAVLEVRTHQRVDAFGFGEYTLDEFLARPDIVVPQQHADFGAHQRSGFADPLGVHGT